MQPASQEQDANKTSVCYKLNTATGNLMGCVLMYSITTYLLAPRPLSLLSNTLHSFNHFNQTLVFSTLSLLLYSTARLSSVTNKPNTLPPITARMPHVHGLKITSCYLEDQ